MAASEANTGGDARRDVGGVRIRVLNIALVAVAVVVAFILMQAVAATDATYHEYTQATESYVACEAAANNMKEGSNYLTTQIRHFVITHDVEYLDRYFTEANETRLRDIAVEQLEQYAADKPAYQYLKQSRERSEELMEAEYYAAKLVLDATGQQANKGADTMASIALNSADIALSTDEKLALATDEVFGDSYQQAVDDIESNVALCKTELIAEIEAAQDSAAQEVDRLLAIQQALAGVLLAVIVAIILLIAVLILMPIKKLNASIEQNKPLPLIGARELRVMSEKYNDLYEANLKHNDDLRRKAEHDHLTGLYNREVFERLLHVYRNDPVALMLIDADYFKNVNDTYGHDAGDKILKKLAGLLQKAFRSSDFPCRIGGDEFAVIMTEMTPDLKHVVEAKIRDVADGMRDDSDGLPAMTLSIGVAFSGGANAQESEETPGSADVAETNALYKHADEALYRVKEAGRNGHGFY